MPTFAPGVLRSGNRSRNDAARRLPLAVQAVQVVDVIFRTLGVLRLFVVSAAARKPCCIRVLGSGQGAVADAVAVHVLVARKAAQPVQILLAQNLAAIQRRLRIREGIADPVVHADIQIADHEHRSLQTLGQIERQRCRTQSTRQPMPAAASDAWCRRGREMPLTADRPARCASASRSRDQPSAHPRSRPESRHSSQGR